MDKKNFQKFLNLEQSRKLKALGFNEPTYQAWNKDTGLSTYVTNGQPCEWDNEKFVRTTTINEALIWLMDKYEFIISMFADVPDGNVDTHFNKYESSFLCDNAPRGFSFYLEKTGIPSFDIENAFNRLLDELYFFDGVGVSKYAQKAFVRLTDDRRLKELTALGFSKYERYYYKNIPAHTETIVFSNGRWAYYSSHEYKYIKYLKDLGFNDCGVNFNCFKAIISLTDEDVEGSYERAINTIFNTFNKNILTQNFEGDVLITDPCYFTKEEDKESLCNYSELGFTKYIVMPTIYGDGSWNVLSINPNEYAQKVEQDGEICSGAKWYEFSKGKKKIGSFCADSGTVGVFLMDEVRKYNPDFELKNHIGCIVEDTTTVDYIVNEEEDGINLVGITKEGMFFSA